MGPRPADIAVGRWFRHARLVADVKLKDAAALLGLSERQLERVEKGCYPVKPLWVRWAQSEWGASPPPEGGADVAPGGELGRRLEGPDSSAGGQTQ
jgi:hypothetical protein